MDNLLQQLLDDSPDAILIADSKGIIRYWNSGAVQIFGHTAENALGSSLDLIIPEYLRGRHWDGYNRVMASGETKYKTGLLTAPGARMNGSAVSLEFSIVLLHDESGAMQGCASIMRDVSERWRIEKELREKLAVCETVKPV